MGRHFHALLDVIPEIAAVGSDNALPRLVGAGRRFPRRCESAQPRGYLRRRSPAADAGGRRFRVSLRTDGARSIGLKYSQAKGRSRAPAAGRPKLSKLTVGTQEDSREAGREVAQGSSRAIWIALRYGLRATLEAVDEKPGLPSRTRRENSGSRSAALAASLMYARRLNSS